MAERLDFETKAIMEYIIAFLVDRLYNGLFNAAVENVKQGQGRSISEEYKASLIALNGVLVEGSPNAKQTVSQLTRGLHNKIQEHMGGTILDFNSFVDKIVSAFIPARFFTRMTDIERGMALSKILTESTRKYVNHLLHKNNNGMLIRIIDDHKNTKNVRELQDVGIIILSDIRDKLYSEFITSKHLKSSSSAKKESENVINKLNQTILDLQRQIDRKDKKIEKLEAEISITEKNLHSVLSQMEKKIEQKVNQMFQSSGMNSGNSSNNNISTVQETDSINDFITSKNNDDNDADDDEEDQSDDSDTEISAADIIARRENK